ncbi:hypothetical protein E2562_008455 [Oryza meyeriana var. granulata]|uniref:Uncharacterized protein n=1 Tax=Oryza meyeriana var. granulata TaxID=110450 RepID=A0A6G1EH64_9ORYZ|nr:hypothetical protein E2562_008455 [Oryza meyeriana var. granulata]
MTARRSVFPLRGEQRVPLSEQAQQSAAARPPLAIPARASRPSLRPAMPVKSERKGRPGCCWWRSGGHAGARGGCTGTGSLPPATSGEEGLRELHLIDGDSGAAGPEDELHERGRELFELDGAVAVGDRGVDLVPCSWAEAERAEERGKPPRSGEARRSRG